MEFTGDMPKTQEEAYEFFKRQMAPQGNAQSKMMNLIHLLGQQQGVPIPSVTPSIPRTPTVKRIPDLGKIQNNFERQSLMAKYPGQGDR